MTRLVIFVVVDFPEAVPLLAFLESCVSGSGFRVKGIRSASSPLEAKCCCLASWFCRATADLPAAGTKVGVADHRLTLLDVVQQPIGSLLL